MPIEMFKIQRCINRSAESLPDTFLLSYGIHCHITYPSLASHHVFVAAYNHGGDTLNPRSYSCW